MHLQAAGTTCPGDLFFPVRGALSPVCTGHLPAEPSVNRPLPRAFLLGSEGVLLHLPQTQPVLPTLSEPHTLSHSHSAQHTLTHTGPIKYLSLTCTVIYTIVCILDLLICLEMCVHTEHGVHSFLHSHTHPYLRVCGHTFVSLCLLLCACSHETCLCTPIPDCALVHHARSLGEAKGQA